MSLLAKLGLGKPTNPDEKLIKIKKNSDEGLNATPPKESSKSGQDRRTHIRFLMAERPVIEVELQSGHRVAVKDIGYGGISFDLSAPLKNSLEPQGANVTLHCFGRQAPAILNHVYSRGGTSAFVFQHTIPDTLMFLREPLESLRQGGTLEQLLPEMLKAPYNNAGWLCLRGDGPTDVWMKSDRSGRCEEALMCFRSGKTYLEVSLRSGVISTGFAIDRTDHMDENHRERAAPSLMSKDLKPDLPALRIAAATLMGVSDKQLRKIVDQFAAKVIAEIQKQIADS